MCFSSAGMWCQVCPTASETNFDHLAKMVDIFLYYSPWVFILSMTRLCHIGVLEILFPSHSPSHLLESRTHKTKTTFSHWQHFSLKKFLKPSAILERASDGNIVVRSPNPQVKIEQLSRRWNFRDNTENKYKNEVSQQTPKCKLVEQTTDSHKSHMCVLEKAEGYWGCLVDLSTAELQNSQQVFSGMRTDTFKNVLNYKMF